MHKNMTHWGNFLKKALVMFMLVMILTTCLDTKECTLPLSFFKEVHTTFKNMSPYGRNSPNDSCGKPEILDDKIYITPVEDAAIVIEEAGKKITNFLLLHHRGLSYREEEYNRMLGLLDDYTNIMTGCVPAESDNHPLRILIQDYFEKLDTLVGKKNYTECTKWKCTFGIRKTLKLISHLNSRLRANSSTT